jgi:molecular chaperone GrpE
VKPLVEKNEQATEEVTVEENEEAAEAVQEEVEVSPEQQKIEELEAKLEESENRYLRLQADFDNFRRRAKSCYRYTSCFR